MTATSNGHVPAPPAPDEPLIMVDVEGVLWVKETPLDMADWDDESRDRHAAALRWWLFHD